MADATDSKKRFAGLKLLLLFCLGCFFLWLAYCQLTSYLEWRRWEVGTTILPRTVLNMGFFLMLTFGAWIGPIAYFVRIYRGQPRDDRSD